MLRVARTPIESLGPGLWAKRDDRSHAVYGGNKVRKLAPLLARARARGATRLLTVGAAGSHHVLATTVFGRRAGFDVAAALAPQRWSAHAESNLRAAVALGLDARVAKNARDVAWRVLTEARRGDLLIPSGGTTPRSLEAELAGADDLADAIARGELPVPDVARLGLVRRVTAAVLLAGGTLALAEAALSLTIPCER